MKRSAFFIARLLAVLTLVQGGALAEDAIDRAPEGGRVADTGWREGDAEPAFVARLREAARRGGDCRSGEAAFRELAARTHAAFPAKVAVAGKPLTLEWTAPSSGPVPPSWLVVSADGPVRFAGEGFYALTPGAIAPFGLSAGKGKTRALVALFGAAPPEGGRIDIVPLQAGSLEVTAHLAAFLPDCGREAVSTLASGEIAVAVSSEPSFFVRDPFSFEAPSVVLASPDGGTTTEIYGDRYRLIEAGTNAVLSDREGRGPNYSPTGRFLIAANGDGFDVLDTVDGTSVATLENGDVAWENADSFVINAQPAYGALDARNPLLPGYQLGFGDGLLDCTACPGLATRFMLDLENDVALRIGGQGILIDRLSGSREVLQQSIEDPFDEELMAETAAGTDAFVESQTGALPLSRPERWSFRGGLKLSSLVEEYAETGDESFDRWLARMKAGVVHAPKASRKAIGRREALQVVGLGRSRGAVALDKPVEREDAMTNRLINFGLDLPRPLRPDFTKTGSPDEDADAALARRIVEAVPRAGSLFEPMADFGCVPDASTETSPKIFAFFNDAMEFRVGERALWLTLFSCKWTSGGTYEPNFYLFDSASQDAFTRLGEDNPAQPSSGLCVANIGYCGVEASLFDERYLMIWSRESRALLLYDIDARRTVFRQFDLPRGELLKEAFYSAADRHVVQVNTDGSFFVYDADTGARVLEGRYVDDETIAWTPDLRFDASPEGANYVNLRFPGQRGQHTFQQFSRTVRKPGLVRSVVERGYRPASAPIGVPPAIEGELRSAGGRIRGAVTTRGATEIRVYQDGLRTDVLAVDKDGAAIEFDVAHLGGARWVSLVAADAAGLVSLPVGRDLSEAGGELPTVHILTVGIDRYGNEGIPSLGYAREDAATLFDAMQAQDGKSIRLGVGANLSDEAASPEAILSKARQVVEAAKAGETIVISFAGHGLTGRDGRFYMATSATRLDDIAGTALDWQALSDILTRSAARVVVFLDACHSGAAGTGLFATNDAAAEDVLGGIPSGLLVFSASKGRQLSEEVAALGGGVFTNAVADVIARKRSAYDLDGNGAIEVSELYAGVKRRVSELTDGRQVPWLARSEMVGDFALF